jgi:octaprenyl-diphosphate synthase
MIETQLLARPGSEIAPVEIEGWKHSTRPMPTSPDIDYRRELACVSEQLKEPLAACERLLLEQLQSSDERLQAMLGHVSTLGGKRLRPILLLLAASSRGAVTSEAIRLATAVELVHAATLVHDDILDEADCRRHRPTLHRLFSPQASLLVGDWLFTQAYFLCNQSSSTLPGRWLAEAAKDVCEGEIRQSLTAGTFGQSVSDYLEMLGLKTGSLCAVSCRLGAWSAGGDDRRVQLFHEFGWTLGQAFQVHDDYLDFWGDAQKMGKPVGRDLAMGKPTLPVLRFLEVATPADRQRLQRAVQAEDTLTLEECLALFAEYDIESFTRDMAIRLVRQADVCLEQVAEAERLGDSHPFEALRRLAMAAVLRSA